MGKLTISMDIFNMMFMDNGGFSMVDGEWWYIWQYTKKIYSGVLWYPAWWTKTNIAIENGPVEIVDFPMKIAWWFSIIMLVHRRVMDDDGIWMDMWYVKIHLKTIKNNLNKHHISIFCLLHQKPMVSGEMYDLWTCSFWECYRGI